MKYHDRNQESGAASVKTVYLARIKQGFTLEAKHFSATIFTSAPGDYTTAKYIYLGYILGKTNYYLDGHDVQPGSGKNSGMVVVKNVSIPEGARPFAYFEDTSTSQKYEVMINGTLIPVNAAKE